MHPMKCPERQAKQVYMYSSVHNHSHAGPKEIHTCKDEKSAIRSFIPGSLHVALLHILSTKSVAHAHLTRFTSRIKQIFQNQCRNVHPGLRLLD